MYSRTSDKALEMASNGRVQSDREPDLMLEQHRRFCRLFLFPRAPRLSVVLLMSLYFCYLLKTNRSKHEFDSG